MENANSYATSSSPPPAGSGVRRHVSLTYGAQGAGATRPKMASSGLKRSGTLQTPMPVHPPPSQEAIAAAEEEEYTYDDPANYEEEYYGKQYGGPTSPVGRSSPWNNGNNDWRNQASGNAAIDDVQRALSALELNNAGAQVYTPNYQTGGQSAHPPRFNPAYPPPNQAPGMRSNNGAGRGNNGGKLQLVTEADGRKTPVYSQGGGQPQTTAATGWDQKDRVLTGRSSNPNLQQGYHSKSSSGSGASVPNVPPLPAQYLQQQRPGLGVMTNNLSGQARTATGQTPTQAFANTPIDVPSLIATKGYNPATFDTRPTFVSQLNAKSTLLTTISRLVSSSSSLIPKTTCTNHSSTRSGVRPILETKGWIRLSRKLQGEDLFTYSSALTPGIARSHVYRSLANRSKVAISVAWRRCLHRYVAMCLLVWMTLIPFQGRLFTK